MRRIHEADLIRIIIRKLENVPAGDDPAPLAGHTRSERFNNDDIRVCELAVEISEAQRREILEMEWLIDDIDQNGAATTPEEARQREVPDFEVAAERECNVG